jgi:prepilin-type N-terminal cleavage/methylation domain-containing protein
MPSRGRTGRGEPGFTLIEVLVTMLVIGILAAIALSAYLSHRDAARIAAIQSDLRHAYVVVVSQRTTTGELPPDFPSLIAAGHRPSAPLLPQEGADVRYQPDAGCLSIAHPAMPDLPFMIDLNDGSMTEGACPD